MLSAVTDVIVVDVDVGDESDRIMNRQPILDVLGIGCDLNI